jgi:hypothetical protein
MWNEFRVHRLSQIALKNKMIRLEANEQFYFFKFMFIRLPLEHFKLSPDFKSLGQPALWITSNIFTPFHGNFTPFEDASTATSA